MSWYQQGCGLGMRLQCLGGIPFATPHSTTGELRDTGMALPIEELEDYLRSKGVSPELLKSQCSKDHLVIISRDVDDWQTQAPYFGLDDADVKAIKREHDGEELRRRAMLLKWKQMKAFRATYRELVSTFLKVKRADLAQCVCDIIAESKAEAAPPSQTTQTSTATTSSTSDAMSTHHTPTPVQPDFTHFGQPTLQLLMNLVGWRVKSKWREIGSGLGVADTELTSIQAEEAGRNESNQQCMRRVFSFWHSAQTSSYTWQNLANVLASPTVKEKFAVQELYKSLCNL